MADNYFAKKRKEREAATGPVQLTAPDPTLGYRTTEAKNKADASSLDPARARADLVNSNLTAAINQQNLQMKQQELKDAKAKSDAEAEDRKRAESLKGESLAKIATTIQRLDAIANDAGDNGGWFETGKSGAFARDWFGPGSPAYDLDRKVQGVRGANFVEAIRQLKQASSTGSTGAGGLTETEGKKLEDALAVLDPNMSHGEFIDQINQARETYLRSYRAMGGDDPMIDPELAKANPVAPQDPTPRQGLSKGGTRSEVDPYLRGVAGKVGAMIADPRRYTDKEIIDFVNQSGVPAASTNIMEVLKYRNSPDFIEWQRRNPGTPYNIGPSFYTKDVPLSGTASFMNDAAQSPLGAATISAANALSVNNLANLSADPAEAHTGMDLLRGEYPGATLVGDMAGQALFEAGAGRLPGIRALRGRRFAQLGGDAAYNGAAGYSETGDIGDGIGGALGGAVGGVAGRGAARGIGGALRGVTSPSLSYLAGREVPLTIGQIGRGSGSTIGNAIAWTEDRLAGLPGADAIINSARRRGQEGFNRAAFREIGTDQIGSAGVAAGEQAVDGAYSFLDSANIPLDAPYAGTNAAIRSNLLSLPAFGPEVGRAMDVTDRAARGGALSGRDWQSAVRAARQDRATLRGAPFSDRAANALDDVEQNLLGLAGRQGPLNAAGQLQNANALNMRFQTLTEALDNQVAQRGEEMFTPQRLDNAARAARRNFGGRVASMRGDRPFYELTRAGMDVMPNDVPDSGTAGRALLYSGLLSGVGAGIGNSAAPEGSESTGAALGSAPLALATGLAAFYSEPAQRRLGHLLLGSRNGVSERIGRAISDRLSPSTGRLGQALMRDLMLYPEIRPQ